MCDCSMCQLSAKLKAFTDTLSPKQYEEFGPTLHELWTCMETSGMDAEYWKMQYDGGWPQDIPKDPPSLGVDSEQYRAMKKAIQQVEAFPGELQSECFDQTVALAQAMHRATSRRHLPSRESLINVVHATVVMDKVTASLLVDAYLELAKPKDKEAYRLDIMQKAVQKVLAFYKRRPAERAVYTAALATALFDAIEKKPVPPRDRLVDIAHYAAEMDDPTACRLVDAFLELVKPSSEEPKEAEPSDEEVMPIGASSRRDPKAEPLSGLMTWAEPSGGMLTGAMPVGSSFKEKRQAEQERAREPETPLDALSVEARKAEDRARMALVKEALAEAKVERGGLKVLTPEVPPEAAQAYQRIIPEDPPDALRIAEAVKQKATEEIRLLRWIAERRCGTSSLTIVSVFTDYPWLKARLDSPDVPHDAGDFEHCADLMTVMPEWRSRLGEVVAKYPEWEPFVSQWDRLTLTLKNGGDNCYRACKACKVKSDAIRAANANRV